MLSKNYISLNDDFQAVFILESIIENFTNYPGLISEAIKLLESVNKNNLDEDFKSKNLNDE